MKKANTKIKRLIFATGPWQIIIATSAMNQNDTTSTSLYEDHLLLWFYQVPDEIKQIMIQIAKLLWNWKSILQIDENFLDISTIEVSDINFSQNLKIIKERINIKNLNEIWLCLIAGKFEKLLIESHKNTNIVIYEDGLCLYSDEIAYSNYLDKGFRSKLKKFKHQSKNLIYNKQISYKYNNCGLLKQHINRLSKACLFLVNITNSPKYLTSNLIQKINNDYLINSINKINDSIKFDLILDSYKSSNSMALVLSQCFAKWNRMSWSDELNLYRGVFRKLIQRGITPLWKEHPRADKPFFPALLNDDWDITPIELNVHFAWPIEILVHQITIIGCISISSSSLFYLKELFDIPTYTLANEVTLSKHDARIAKLAIDRIPPFSSMFES